MVKYKNIEIEMKNLTRSLMLFRFITKLDKGIRFKFKDFPKKAQTGYCEDLCAYLYFKYKHIKVLNVNYQHFVFKYKNKYYDSLTPHGVSAIKDIPFFKNKIIKTVKVWSPDELPNYYMNSYKEMFKCQKI